MKLLAGTQKGRRLRNPPTSTLRPTSGKVREALFAILSDRIQNATVLDLYAGTGALGLEALSRGARQVVFVEQAPASLRVLRDNIRHCASQEKSRVVGQDVKRFLQMPHFLEGEDRFDLIFMDPPYQTRDVDSVLELLGRSTFFFPHSLLVMEHFSKRHVAEHAGDLKRFRQARYGDTTLSFYSLGSALQGSSCV